MLEFRLCRHQLAVRGAYLCQTRPLRFLQGQKTDESHWKNCWLRSGRRRGRLLKAQTGDSESSTCQEHQDR
jgi:hypothetical protein